LPRLPLTVILLTVVIDAMGIGLILPVMPALLQEVTGTGLGQAALWGGLLSTSFAVMQFLCGPGVGVLSDRFGRRPVLIVSLAVMAVDYLVMALAGSVWLLLAGRVVGGITAATQSTALAAIADMATEGQKAQGFGLVGAAFGAGFVLGPVIGGVLAEFGTRAPFLAAAALAGANAVFAWAVLPETAPRAAGAPRRSLNPFAAFRAMGRLPGVARLLLLFFLYQVAFFVYPSVWAYFTTARFGWSPSMTGLSLAVFGIGIALVQGGLIRVILPVLGEARTVLFGIGIALVQGGLIRVILPVLGEARTVLFGIGFNACAFLAMSLVTNGTLALILTPLTALGAVVTPALQGMMSRAVAEDRQGELQGVISAAGAVAMILSPLLMTRVFAAFADPATPPFLPGAPFLLSMALMGASAAVFLWPARGPAAAR
jgi:DHA1 family tetracycline resistance protein-like MFS transporter